MPAIYVPTAGETLPAPISVSRTTLADDLGFPTGVDKDIIFFVPEHDGRIMEVDFSNGVWDDSCDNLRQSVVLLSAPGESGEIQFLKSQLSKVYPTARTKLQRDRNIVSLWRNDH